MSDKPWYRNGLRFACTGCGQCCTGAPGAVWVTSDEIENLAAHLQMPVEAFSRKYIRTVGGRLSLYEHPDNFDCVFLKERRCTIYDVRPLQCRTFPWWPGVLTSEASWKEAGKRCEGICDAAPVVSFEEIERNANLHRE